jgi:hypothetical protein
MLLLSDAVLSASTSTAISYSINLLSSTTSPSMLLVYIVIYLNSLKLILVVLLHLVAVSQCNQRLLVAVYKFDFPFQIY